MQSLRILHWTRTRHSHDPASPRRPGRTGMMGEKSLALIQDAHEAPVDLPYDTS